MKQWYQPIISCEKKEKRETDVLLNRAKKMKGFFLFKANQGFILFISIREYYEIKVYTKA